MRQCICALRDGRTVPIVRRQAITRTETESSESKEVGPRRWAPQDQVRTAQRVVLHPPRGDGFADSMRPLRPENHRAARGGVRPKVDYRLPWGCGHAHRRPLQRECRELLRHARHVGQNEILGRAVAAPIPTRILEVKPGPEDAAYFDPGTLYTLETPREPTTDAELGYLNKEQEMEVRVMLAAFASMWPGDLWLSRTTQNRIDLQPDARPVFTQP